LVKCEVRSKRVKLHEVASPQFDLPPLHPTSIIAGRIRTGPYMAMAGPRISKRGKKLHLTYVSHSVTIQDLMILTGGLLDFVSTAVL